MDGASSFFACPSEHLPLFPVPGASLFSPFASLTLTHLSDECVIFHQPHPRSYNTNGALFGMTAYQDLAKEILAQGKLANIRPESVGDSNVEAQKILYKNDGSVDESVEARLPRHRFNGPDWGLAKTEISEVTYMPMCNT
jgi:hypothetical protein